MKIHITLQILEKEYIFSDQEICRLKQKLYYSSFRGVFFVVFSAQYGSSFLLM